jgi:hypothetical protein
LEEFRRSRQWGMAYDFVLIRELRRCSADIGSFRRFWQNGIRDSPLHMRFHAYAVIKQEFYDEIIRYHLCTNIFLFIKDTLGIFRKALKLISLPSSKRSGICPYLFNVFFQSKVF